MAHKAQPKVSIVGFGAVGKALHALLPDVFPNSRVSVFDRPEVATKNQSSMRVEEMNAKSAFDADIAFFCSSNRHLVETLRQANHIRKDAVIVSVARSTERDLTILRERHVLSHACLLTDCGVEPGLADALIVDYARFFEGDISADVKCGGYVRPRPNNLLGYRSLFGTAYLPLGQREAYMIRNGCLEIVPRFSGVDRFVTGQSDELEAFHDGMTSHLRSVATNQKFVCLTQKTVRWPGYVDAIRHLKTLRLLDEMHNDQLGASPKAIFERLTAGAFEKRDMETSITVLAISARGRKAGAWWTKQHDISFRDYRSLNSMMIATALPPLFCAAQLHKAGLAGIVNPANLLADNLDAFFSMARRYGAEISAKCGEKNQILAQDELTE